MAYVESNVAKSDAERYDNYLALCNIVLEIVKQDDVLQELSRLRLDSTCYKDDGLRILTHDIIYFGSKLESEADFDLSDVPLRYKEEKIEMSTTTDVSLYTILYGPPGTGKTYNTVIYAVAIIENRLIQSVNEEEYAEVFERYNEYKTKGWIDFTTFHQSYGYEEFIEGIKPKMTDDGDLNYSIQSGMFKRFCEEANTGGVDFETA